MPRAEYEVDGKWRTIRREYVKNKREKINSKNNDGCSGVADKLHGFDFNWVCDIHDDFYQQEFQGTQKEADELLFAFMCQEVRKQARSPNHEFLGYVIAYRRYCFLRAAGWLFWREHEGALSIWEKAKSWLLWPFT